MSRRNSWSDPAANLYGLHRPFDANLRKTPRRDTHYLQGVSAETVISQIVAEELGVLLEEVRITAADTGITPLDPGTFGSGVTAHDCGRPINPMLVEGQLEGSVVGGMGQALEEKRE